MHVINLATPRIQFPPINLSSRCCSSVDDFFMHYKVLCQRKPGSYSLLTQLYAEGTMLVQHLLVRKNLEDMKDVMEAIKMPLLMNNYPEAVMGMVRAIGEYGSIEPLCWLLQSTCNIGGFVGAHGINPWKGARIGLRVEHLMVLPNERRLFVLEKLAENITAPGLFVDVKNYMVKTLVNDADFCAFLRNPTNIQRAVELSKIFPSRQDMLFQMLDENDYSYPSGEFCNLLIDLYAQRPEKNTPLVLKRFSNEFQLLYKNMRLFLACRHLALSVGFPQYLWNWIFKMSGILPRRRLGAPFLSNFNK